MYADRENLARLNGQPLLNDAGMEAVSNLLDAHISYEAKKYLHSNEISDLQRQIDTLAEKRDGLIRDREEQLLGQNQARLKNGSLVKKTTASSEAGNNNIYAAILHNSAASKAIGGLWNPESLVAADQMGRSFVGLDQALRSAHQSQPVMLVQTERSNWTNLFLGRTRQRAGIKPSTIFLRSKYDHNQNVSRQALALPVNENGRSVYQINPRNFGREEFIDDYLREHSEFSTIQDGFTLALPDDSPWSAPKVGEYDLPEDGTSELYGSFGWESSSSIILAIGNLSVAHALVSLQNRFAEKSPHKLAEQKPLFEQLGQRALGKSQIEIQKLVEA